VVCGVGHETDFSIADFVADLRAATPTAAAQAVVPERRELAERALDLARRLDRAQVRATQSREQRLDTAARLLRSPSSHWRQRSEALAAIGARLRVAARTSLLAHRQRLARASAGLRRPDVDAARRDVATLRDRLQRAGAVVGQRREARLEALTHKLELVSPLAVLKRGYAIVRTAQGTVVRVASGVGEGEQLGVQLAEGTLDVEVLARHPGATD
jgi:exodeoxyribonuclease VII large subunit